MAIVVEDGTGLASAESLIAVAVADTYLAARGLTAWALLATAVKEAALVQASEYLNETHWSGYRLKATQALSWPRSFDLDDYRSADSNRVVNPEGQLPATGQFLPPAVIAATSRIAYAVAVEGVSLFATVGNDSAIRKVEAGSVSVEFDDAAITVGLQGRPNFPWLHGLLGIYLKTSGANTSAISRRVVRA